MKADYELISTLFHYCFEFQNFLRPILNTKKLDEIDHLFMDQKLKEFKAIIDDCLNAETLTLSLSGNFKRGENVES